MVGRLLDGQSWNCGVISDSEKRSGSQLSPVFILLMFKRTCERWGLKDGEGKLRIETSGGE
jgi:hypothetical protein